MDAQVKPGAATSAEALSGLRGRSSMHRREPYLVSNWEVYSARRSG